MKILISFVALVGLTACTGGPFSLGPVQNTNSDVVSGEPTPVPTAAPAASPAAGVQTRPVLPPPPSTTARTVEDFDTTTEADRVQATAAPATGERRLGTTIATLGSPTDPGIWVKTPLVGNVTQGRVELNGTSVNVELRPSGGGQGTGSQISLAAMRLIGAPLTSLPEVTVYAN